MKLTIVGSGSAAPNPGSASSCYLLETDSGQVLLECGHGAAAKMLLFTTLDRLDAVVISHMHPDHFFDLVPLKYLIMESGRKPLPLYVPPTGPAVLGGVADGLGENGRFWSNPYDIRVFDPDQPLELPGLRATMTKTHHFIPAWCMRLEDSDSGGVLGYTSDTSLTPPVVAHLKGSDLLLAEASIDQQEETEAQQGHMTGAEAGELASEAQVAKLVLTHYRQSRAQGLLVDAREAFSGPCELAVEGARYTI